MSLADDGMSDEFRTDLSNPIRLTPRVVPIRDYRAVPDAVPARCRSCGETGAVLGDPLLCSNCVVYAPPAFAGLLAPPELAELDTCRDVTIDIDDKPATIRIRSAEEMTDEDRTAFAAVVAAAQRRFEAEAPTRCGNVTATIHGDRDLVCTRQPHPDDDWHADGNGTRWRWDGATTIRRGRNA